MSDSDLIKLYSGRILDLAGNIPAARRLDAPDGSAKKRSPLCGSSVVVDVTVKAGRVSRFGQDVKACALGQAAAAIVGAQAVGLTRADIELARDQLRTMLTEDGPTPDAPFDGFEVLRPARDFKNRHSSILLALEATLGAMQEAEKAACA